LHVATSGGVGAVIKLDPTDGSGAQVTELGNITDIGKFQVRLGGSGGVELASAGANSWSAMSDERLKNIIEPITNAVPKVDSLRTVIGTYKDDSDYRHPFLIAQDVPKVLPESVSIGKDGYLSLSYTDMVPLLAAAIKELKAQNDALEARIAALEK